jgi:hypothetical protein
MPSLFTVSNPSTAFQWWFVVYLYVLPLLLYASWAALSLMDLGKRAQGGEPSSLGWGAVVLLLPLAGGAAYLLGAARSINARARIAIVFAGLIAWLVPLIAGIWLAGGPLGPKALS